MIYKNMAVDSLNVLSSRLSDKAPCFVYILKNPNVI